MKDTLTSLEVMLNEMQLAKLNQASAIELGLPYDFFTRPTVRQFIYGGMYDKIDRR